MEQALPYQFENQDFDFKRIIRLILSHWWLILLCVAIAVIAANVYNRYAQPVYSAAGTIIIKDESSSTLGADPAQLQDFDIFKIKKNLSTEIEIIKSHNVVERAVSTINPTFIKISYFVKGRLKTTELYKDSPFIVEYDTLFPQAFERPFYLEFDNKDGYKFIYEVAEDEYAEPHKIDETVENQFGKFRVKRNEARPRLMERGIRYYFVVHYPWTPIGRIRGGIGVFRPNEETSILAIAFQDEVPERAMDVVNALIDAYASWSVEAKTKMANGTIKFINEQLSQMEDSLMQSEQSLENFKRTKGVVNLSPDFALGRFKDYDTRKLEMQIQLQALDTLEQHIRQGEDASLISPTTMGTQDSRFSSSLTRLHELETQRKNLLAYATDQNPEIRNIEKKISQTQEKLFSDLNSYREALRNNMKMVDLAINDFEASLDKVPTTEREFIGIQRKYSLNSSIYQYLLQKRENASIAKAATVSDNVVLDYAGIPGTPIKPKKSLAYTIGLFLALTVSLSYIFIRDLLDDTIDDQAQVEKQTRIPVLGTVSHARSRKGSSLVVNEKPKSAVAESFRSIRTNLQFLASHTERKIVVVTSTVGGEGKTFFSLNIAAIMAASDKKVLLIGLDLRKPKLHLELNIPQDNGITKVLIGKARAEEVIVKSAVENLHIMAAGPIPPNPSELIMSETMKNLLAELRPQYDYIFIDTPPVGLVTDALIAMSYADINIYLLRQKKSKKDFLDNINKLHQEQGAKNIAIVLNDVKGRSYGYGYGGYGYGYGYGYYEEGKRPFLKRLFSGQLFFNAGKND